MQHIINKSSINHSVSNISSKGQAEVSENLKMDQVQNLDESKKIDSSEMIMKKQFNRSILESHLEVNMSTANNPMALVFKAAIEEINIALEDELGENAIQSAYDSGLDVSPEATADRIVSMSTAFFSQYRDQNPEMTDEEAADKFSEIVEGGIDTGFSQAKEVLNGLNVLEGDIAKNIDSTYELVQEKLMDFVNQFKEEGDQAKENENN